VGGPFDAVRPRHPHLRPVPSSGRALARRGSLGPAAGGADPVANGGTACVRRPHRPAPCAVGRGTGGAGPYSLV
jgi:hypothetical protein